jgi:hypothetical protein
LLEFLRWTFSPEVTVIGAICVLGIGWALGLATVQRNIKLAHIFFTWSGIWFYGAVLEWLMKNGKLAIPKPLVAFFVCGLIGAAWMWAYGWVETNRKEAGINSQIAEASQAPPPSPISARKPDNSEESPKNDSAKKTKPKIDQKSYGDNSPNVVGPITQGPGSISQIGNGTIIINPPSKAPEEKILEPKTPGELLSEGFHEKITHYTFTLGENGASVSTTMAALQAGAQPFRGFPITVFLKENDETIHFKIEVPNGVVVTDGEFSLNEPFWDRNYDKYAFEVVDEKQQPVLQVFRKTPSSLVINGIFRYQEGTVIADDKGWRPMKPGDTIKRIFKYPSRNYQGKLAD